MHPATAPLLALCLTVVCAPPAMAQHAATGHPWLAPDTGAADPWQISASPYAWAAGMRGNAGNPPARLDSRFRDIIGHLDLAFMGAIEARHGSLSLIGDVMYGQLSASGTLASQHLRRDVKVTSTSFSGFLGAGYRVLEDERWHLDLMGGARTWHASTKTTIKGGAHGVHQQRESATWTDAVAGLRGQYALNEHWYLTGWGVIGAGQAKLDWDLTAAVAYRVKSNLSAVVGYRALGVNFNRNDFVYKVVQQGPILGLSYQF